MLVLLDYLNNVGGYGAKDAPLSTLHLNAEDRKQWYLRFGIYDVRFAVQFRRVD